MSALSSILRRLISVGRKATPLAKAKRALDPAVRAAILRGEDPFAAIFKQPTNNTAGFFNPTPRSTPNLDAEGGNLEVVRNLLASMQDPKRNKKSLSTFEDIIMRGRR